MKVEFDTTIGDDIEVTVSGDYDGPDKSVGYGGSFWPDSVTLRNDSVNIICLLSDKLINRLENEGFYASRRQAEDAKHDAAEHRYQMQREV